MSKDETPIKDLGYYKSNAEEDYLTTPISVLRYISELENNAQYREKKAVQEAMNPIIEECKRVIDNPNQLETTKGFASIVWYELEKAQKYLKRNNHDN